MIRIVNRAISHGELLADLDRYAAGVESSVAAGGTVSAAAMPHSPWGRTIESLGMTLDLPGKDLWAGPSQGGTKTLPAFEIGKAVAARGSGKVSKPSKDGAGTIPPPAPEPKFPGRSGDIGDYVEWADFYRNLKARFPGLTTDFDQLKKYARDLLIEKGVEFLGDKFKEYAGDALADLLSDSIVDAVTTATGTAAGGMMDGIMGRIEEAFGKIGDLVQNPSMILDLAIAKGLPKLFDKGIDALFGIDADDSPGTVVGKYFGKMIVEGMVDALMAGVDSLATLAASFEDLQARLFAKIDAFFNGTPGLAVLPVARVGDKDDKVDVVLGNLPTVIARGQPVARATDLMTPSNKPLTEGSATVLAGGLPLSRITSATAIPSAIVKGEPTVLVGGVTKVISPPPPPVTPPKGGGSSAGGTGAAGGSSSGGAGAKGPPPKDSGKPEQATKPVDESKGTGKSDPETKKEIPPKATEKPTEPTAKKDETGTAATDDKTKQKIQDGLNTAGSVADGGEAAGKKFGSLADDEAAKIDGEKQAKIDEANQKISDGKQKFEDGYVKHKDGVSNLDEAGELPDGKAKDFKNALGDTQLESGKELMDDAGRLQAEGKIDLDAAKNLPDSTGDFSGKTLGKIGKGAGKVLGPLGTVLDVAEGKMKYDEADANDDDRGKVKAVTETVGSMGGGGLGAAGGAAAGAVIGSVVPVIGTAAGAIVGGLIGAFGGSAIGEVGGGVVGDKIGDYYELPPSPKKVSDVDPESGQADPVYIIPYVF